MTGPDWERPDLRVVQATDDAVEWVWFCAHCAAPPLRGAPPPPTLRVCSSCGLGVLLEARSDAVPTPDDAFVVVDSALLVQALSHHAEQLLSVAEDEALNRPVTDLLVPADAETRGSASLAGAILEAVGGSVNPIHAFVRPSSTFGVRIRARIAGCGPPRAALLVLERSFPSLRPVVDS